MFRFLFPIAIGILIGLELQVLICRWNMGKPIQPITALLNFAEKLDKKKQPPKIGEPPKANTNELHIYHHVEK